MTYLVTMLEIPFYAIVDFVLYAPLLSLTAASLLGAVVGAVVLVG